MDNTPYSLESDGGQEPLRDVNSSARLRIQDEDIEGHHTDRWQQQAMYVDIHMPSHGDRKHRSRRRHRRSSTDPVKVTTDTVPTPTSPSEHVQQLLQVAEGEDDERPAHDIFCEMSELRRVPQSQTQTQIPPESMEYEWRETARWVKFEEDVEEGGERWSKPHVASLSLHSLFEVRRSIVSGLVMLDVVASTMREISDRVVEKLEAKSLVTVEQKEKIVDLLLARHRHQHERRHDGRLPIIRSLADIGRRGSDRRMEDHRPSVSAAPGLTLGESSSKDLREVDQQDAAEVKFNEHFAKKLTPGSEAASILVGDVEVLSAPVVAFIRLSKAVSLGSMLEVPIPTRFIFIQLQPTGTPQRCHEIGRAVGTLMSDEVFHDVAYKAKTHDDLLAGVDEFLEQVTVLPPGEWDPTIRIEPPKSVPSQEARKVSKMVVPNGTLPNGASSAAGNSGADGPHTHGEEEEPESHIEPTLERTGRLFGGLVADVRRKVPWYLSDFRDALHPQIIASAFFMFFACLTPTVMFGALLGIATGDNMAAMECLLSSSICGVMYHLFSGQPLTIIGPTGPMLVIESIVFNVCSALGWPYLTFRLWIGLWMMLALLLIVMFDLSSLVKYITRFTEESFATLIAVIFIYEAIRKLFHITEKYPVDLNPDVEKDYNCTCYPPNATLHNETTLAMDDMFSTTPLYLTSFNDTNATVTNWESLSSKHCKKLGGSAVGTGCDTPVYVPDVFFFSCLLFIGTFVLCMAFKHFRNTRFFPNGVRVILSDFAVLISIALMVLVDFLVGLHTPKLLVPHNIRPTNPDRDGWLINPFAGPWWTIIVAVLPAALATILVFMDQQITAVIVNRKEHKLKKGSGYHLDLLMISIQIGLCSVLGTPWLVASTVPAVNHVRSLTKESESVAPGERPKFLGVREQRVTGVVVFIFVGLAAFMASVLQFIPMPVLYGISLFMGVASLAGIQLVQRLLIILMPVKYQPDYIFLRHVPLKRVNLFTAIQFIFLVIMGVIEMIEITSILFPLMVLALCFVRKLLDWVFTQQELRWLDDLIPDAHKREKEDKKKKGSPPADNADGDEPGDESKIIEMGDTGTVTIPVKDGKPLVLPASQVTYDARTHKLNISEEMSKTAIWRLMVSDSQNNLAHGNGSPGVEKRRMSDDESSNQGRGKKEPVTFRIEEDETEALVAPSPTVTVIPPSPVRKKHSDMSPV